MQIKENTKRFDINLSLITLTLTVISLINLYSATHSLSSTKINSMFVSQCIWFAIGWGAFFATSLINLNFIKRLAWPIFIINLGLLVSVKFVGKSFYGAQRWLDLGFFRYQPSETMKVSLVLVLAMVLAKKLHKGNLNLTGLLLPVILCAIPFVFTVTQPDLGTALIMFIIGGSMCLFVGINKKVLFATVLLGSMSLPVVWSYGLKPYQKQRILTFLNPGNDLRGGGYNSRQSKIAVGSGLIFGRGYRKGTQSQLQFLPERHTDFIFSVLSEEHGFIGSFLSVLIFLMLFLNIIYISQETPDAFGTLATIGIGSIVFWHFFINIGMITGILPVVGVPLPFFSYGGSSILTTMGALGLVSNVSRKRYLF